MINFSDIVSGSVTLKQNKIHEIATQFGGNCGFLLRVYNEYKSVYCWQSDVPGFWADGVYECISNTDPHSLDAIHTTRLQQFGNIEGVFYLSTVALDTGDQLVYFAFLSRLEPDEINLTKVAELRQLLEEQVYDVDTVLDHANHIPEEVLSNYRSYTFSIDNLDDDNLFELIVIIFNETIKAGGLNIDMPTIVNFIIFLRNHYNNVPYHNWRHATDATQFVFYIISQPNVTRYVKGLDLFTVIFSAICHDVGHNGRTNIFHRQVNSEYAQESGPDQPPLEFHHQKYALEHLYSDFPKIVENFSEEDNRIFKEFTSQIILATDMSKHKDYVNAIMDNIDKFDNSEKLRLLACQAIMKIADLSNTCRPFPEAAIMAAKLQEEWFCQGDDEAAHGIEITKGYDRKTKPSLPNGQIGFYTFVVKGLLNAVIQFFNALDDAQQQFNSNLEEWETLAKQEQQ